MNKLFVFLLIFLLFVSSASALGITPARTSVGFTPGLQQTVQFTVVNSEYKDISLAVFVKGELNGSIQVSETEFDMPSTLESKELSYTFTLPNYLSPGPHNTEIVVLQKPKGALASEAFVGATVAVTTQFVVNVPYPGKYAIADLNVINAQQNAETSFIIPLISLGQDDIENIEAYVEIYDSSNNKISEFSVPGISLAAGQRGELVGKWSANVPLGRYVAKANIKYDNNQEINIEKEFFVGSETLELQQVNVPTFLLGGIAKFEMLIENKWSEPITGAYAQTQVFKDDGSVLADFKSPTYDIPPLNKSTFTSYWDTIGVEQGIYNTSVYMRYGSKYSLQKIQLKVTNTEIIALGLGFVISENGSTGSLVNVLLIIIGVLVAMNGVWFLILRKKLKK